MNKYIPVAARLLIAQIFVISGIFKVTLASKHPDFYSQFGAFLGAHGIPYFVVPLTFIIEIGAGFALFFGFKTRGAAWVLAVYSLFLALGLHSNWDDPKEPVFFMLYVALTGGLLAITALAPTACSLDNLKKKA
ncbi:MAG: DoxX family protein [Methylophilaceae bacterium]